MLNYWFQEIKVSLNLSLSFAYLKTIIFSVLYMKIVEMWTRSLFQCICFLTHRQNYNHLTKFLKKMLVKYKAKTWQNHIMNLLENIVISEEL